MSRMSDLPRQAKHIIVIAAVSLVCLTSAAATARATDTISGRVKDAEDRVLSGVTMTVTTGTVNRICPSTAAGAYVCSGLARRGKYTITPTKDGYVFSPTSRTYDDLRGNALEQNFTASRVQSKNTNRDSLRHPTARND